MSSSVATSAIVPSPRHDGDRFIDTHHAPHAGKNAIHEEIIVRPAGGIASVAHHHDAIIEIARGEYGARNSHICRAACDHDRTDAAGTKLKVEIGLKERAPALLGHHHIAL